MRKFQLALAFTGTILATGFASLGGASAQDASFGRDVWTSQANCSDCHGSMGDGKADDPRSPPGANLRETELDEATLIEVILCGIPGTAMPHFDHKAYEDDRCYGMTRDEMDGTTPPVGPMALTKRHATGLARFILEELAGKGPPTQDQCVALLGSESPRCAQYPK